MFVSHKATLSNTLSVHQSVCSFICPLETLFHQECSFYLKSPFGLKIFQLFATALTLDGQSIKYRPLKIGYLSSSSTNEKTKNIVSKLAGSHLDRLLQNVNSYIGFFRNRRSLKYKDIEDSIDEVHYIAMKYIKFFSSMEKNNNTNSGKSWINLNNLFKSLINHGKVQNKVNDVLFNKLATIMK